MSISPEWVSVGISVASLAVFSVLVPLLRQSIRAEMSEMIAKHNNFDHAHPNLHGTNSIEEKLEEVKRQLVELRLMVEHIVPRRRETDQTG